MLKIIILSLFSLVFFMACDSEKRSSDQPLKSVEYVNVEEFLGKWYVAARMPSFFEEDCINSRAIYGATSESNRISVKNICDDINDSSKENIIEGKARIVDPSNAKLKVKLGDFPSNLFKGDLWVIHLDKKNYDWVVLSDAKGRYLWIMGREPIMKEDLLASLIDWAKQDGWDVDQLIDDNN